MEVMHPQSSGLDVHLKFMIACVFVMNGEERSKTVKRRLGSGHGIEGIAKLFCPLPGRFQSSHVAIKKQGVWCSVCSRGCCGW